MTPQRANRDPGTARFELYDLTGAHNRLVGAFDAPADAPLDQLIAQHAIAAHLTIFRRTERGGYVLLRRGKPP